MVTEILDLQGVKGIGHRHGILTVFVQDEDSASLDQSIYAIMKSNKIQEYDICIWIGVEYFNNRCSIGSPIGERSNEEFKTYGTIAGCVTRRLLEGKNVTCDKEEASEKQHCIIFSGHVANHLHGSDIYFAEPPIAVPQTSLLECDQKADLAALPIENEVLKVVEFDFKFRTAYGEKRDVKVFNFENKELVEKTFAFSTEVYLRGASTKLGIGLLSSDDIITGESTTHYILIEDIEINERFCKPGDSGSMVCHFNPNNDHIDLLALVQGKLLGSEKKYVAVKLKYGLDIFSERHGHVELCDNIYKIPYGLSFTYLLLVNHFKLLKTINAISGI